MLKQMDQDAQVMFAHRVITMLNREQLDFLDKLGKDSLFATGHKMSHNEILKGLINMMMEMGLANEKIDSFKALKAKIMEKARQMQGETK